MELNGVNLCDFCFEPVQPGTVCPNCGLTHETYQPEAGLLMPGANLLGKYIIGRVLGRGGFGVTYLAYSSMLGKVVAVKEYYPTGIAIRGKGEEKIEIVSGDKSAVFTKGANRFYEEASTISKFNNKNNIVSVYEFFKANDTVYYTMEYLKGTDLKGYITLKGGRLQESEAVTIMQGVCEALTVVHSTQTLHRDISPDNIFICTDGSVKLIDFGSAKQIIGGANQVYSVVVKQGFAPVEQYKSNGKQGVWTDIYALGATIYYSVTGKIPPDAMSRVDMPDVEFDSSLGLSPQFTAIINKCLKFRAEDRYQSALELKGALESLKPNAVSVGGEQYVNKIYNGDTGVKVEFSEVGEVLGTMPGFQVQNSYNPNPSYYPNHSQYPNPSQYPPQYAPSYVSEYEAQQNADKKEKSGMIKGIIIGVCALIIIALVVAIIVVLLGNRQPYTNDYNDYNNYNYYETPNNVPPTTPAQGTEGTTAAPDAENATPAPVTESTAPAAQTEAAAQ